MNYHEFEIYAELYKRGLYSLIPIGAYPDGEYFYMTAKQIKLLELLNDNTTTSIGYGGSARSGKTIMEAVAMIMDCSVYPEIAWGLARKELTILVKTTLQTVFKQLNFYGFKKDKHYKHNRKYNFLEFRNNSKIWLIDSKSKPTDPYNTRFGSFELTKVAVDESNETNISVINKLFERTGWKNNDKYNLKRKVLECFNPQKNHVYNRFFKPWKNNSEKDHRKFIRALPGDNPHPAVKEWVVDMLATADKVTIQRQIYGNFEYDDNPYSLCDYDNILAVFENDHIQTEKEKKYITADVARLGSDKAIIGVWRGWELIEVIAFDKSLTTEIQAAINTLRVKHGIPKHQCIADEDGVGGGVVDNCGIIGFMNNHVPFKEKVSNTSLQRPYYENLQTQCVFGLAKKINNNEFYISADISEEAKEEIIEELGTIERDPSNIRKIALVKKAQIKENIGRSPDWRDMLMMRKYFDYIEAKYSTFKFVK